MAAWKWVQKYSGISDTFRTNKRPLKEEIFIDETFIHIEGRDYWLWIARMNPT